MRACGANTDEERRACANHCKTRARTITTFKERGGQGGDDQELAQGRQEDPNAQVRSQSCRDAEGGANPACRTKAVGRVERAGAGGEEEGDVKRGAVQEGVRRTVMACMRACGANTDEERRACANHCKTRARATATFKESGGRAGDEAENRHQRDKGKACMSKCQGGSDSERRSCQKRCER